MSPSEGTLLRVACKRLGVALFLRVDFFIRQSMTSTPRHSFVHYSRASSDQTSDFLPHSAWSVRVECGGHLLFGRRSSRLRQRR
jgi:hypothetical protein